MPPKKRKATAAPSSSAPASTKKVKIGSATKVEQSPSPGRPKRSTSNNAPQYNFTNRRDTTTNGNVGKATNPEAKKPGRPPKKGKTKQGKSGITTNIADDEVESNKDDDIEIEIEIGGLAKPKGRTKASKKVDLATDSVDLNSSNTSHKGRKKNLQSNGVSTLVERGMVNGNSSAATSQPNTQSAAHEDQDEVDDTIQYWLMKAEPESRIEKGRDVKFSIDDLAAKTEPEAWDGVRNPVARNNMRAMLKNDLAFFYHSNCKVPGVAGVMRIVEEHTIDESAFDPSHPYYDPKSTREKPKWEVVRVEFVKKFDNLITLKELRSFAEQGGVLHNMQMLKQSRLSVSSVQPEEWRFILGLAGEKVSLGHRKENEKAEVNGEEDGYESDLDGEGEDGENNPELDGTDEAGVKVKSQKNGDLVNGALVIEAATV